jgi:IclR family transcriptional regulator, acetate operon repressor
VTMAVAVEKPELQDIGAELEKPAYPVGSVYSAIRLLLIIAERGEVRLTEAADKLEVAPSTAHRLLKMLMYFGLASQDTASKAYTPGPGLVRMSLQVVRDLDIRTVALPHIEALVREVGETVHLMALQANGNLACLDSVESPKALRIGSRVGTQLSSLTSASGRAIMAEQPVQDLRRLYPEVMRAAGSRKDFLAELERTRERGYGLQRDESEPGVSAIAASIGGASTPAQFAICSAMPSSRMPDDEIPRIADAVIRCAHAVTSELI